MSCKLVIKRYGEIISIVNLRSELEVVEIIEHYQRFRRSLGNEYVKSLDFEIIKSSRG